MLAPDVARVLPADDDAILEALSELRAKRPVAFPTETVYGLGADATDEIAVARVFELKGRPHDHPLIVHLGSDTWLETYAELTSPPIRARAAALAAAFWPGPLTLVLPAATTVPTAVRGGQPTVAVRVPAHPVALRLLAAFGRALVAPSANRFGHISPTAASHVAGEFPGPLLVLDGGECRFGIESTIVDLTAATPAVLRPGAISAEELAAVLGEVVVSRSRARAGPAESADGHERAAAEVRVPGSLARHYAPSTGARLVPVERLVEASFEPGVAVLTAGIEPPPGFPGRWISLPDNPSGYAHGLYAALRELDSGKPTAILVAEVPAGPGWDAIEDRLARATNAAPEGDTALVSRD